MDKKIRDLIILDAVKNCNHILFDSQEEFSNMYKDGKLFFQGCVEGFELSKKLVCLEQFEQFIISYRNKEEQYRNSIDQSDKDDYIVGLGKRCALEFIYSNLSNVQQETPPEDALPN